MTQSETDPVTRSCIDKKFSILERKIDHLKSQINKKSGFWIFKVHEKSKEELMAQIDESSGISATSRKIFSDIKNWDERGLLCPNVKMYFEREKKYEVETHFQDVKEKIDKREETGLESLISGVEILKNQVIEMFPVPSKLKRLFDSAREGVQRLDFKRPTAKSESPN